MFLTTVITLMIQPILDPAVSHITSSSFCSSSSSHLSRSTTTSGERRSRTRSSAGTTASGWRWWRTGRWMKQESPSCSGRTASHSSGTERSWRDPTSSTRQVRGDSGPDVQRECECECVWAVCLLVSWRDRLCRWSHQSWVLHWLPERRAGTDGIRWQVRSFTLTWTFQHVEVTEVKVTKTHLEHHVCRLRGHKQFGAADLMSPLTCDGGSLHQRSDGSKICFLVTLRSDLVPLLSILTAFCSFHVPVGWVSVRTAPNLTILGHMLWHRVGFLRSHMLKLLLEERRMFLPGSSPPPTTEDENFLSWPTFSLNSRYCSPWLMLKISESKEGIGRRRRASAGWSTLSWSIVCVAELCVDFQLAAAAAALSHCYSDSLFADVCYWIGLSLSQISQKALLHPEQQHCSQDNKHSRNVNSWGPRTPPTGNLKLQLGIQNGSWYH